MKTHNRFSNPALDALLQSSFEDIREHIKISAQSFAFRNMPKPAGDRMGAYFEEHHLKYQALLGENNKKLQFKATCHELAEHRQMTDEQLRNLSNSSHEAKEKQIPIESKIKNTPYPKGKLRLILAWIAIGIIALFEGILSIPVYELWGYSFIESILMGVLFAGVLAAFAHTFLKIIFLGKTVWRRRLIAFSLFLLLIVLFKYMADVRAEYLSSSVNPNAVDAVNMHFSAWPFVMISLLLFTVAVAINYFLMPTKAECDALREYQKLVDDRKHGEDHIAKLEADKAKVQQEHSALKNNTASILEYGSTLEELIISNAKSGYAIFKKNNLMHRSDNTQPDCFSDTYPFTFTTYFHLVKSLNHENDI